MSKQLFELMREREIQTSNFLPTKKEIENSGRLFAKQILSHGEIDKYELFSQAERLATVTANIRDEIKSHLPKEKLKKKAGKPQGILGGMLFGLTTIFSFMVSSVMKVS